MLYTFAQYAKHYDLDLTAQGNMLNVMGIYHGSILTKENQFVIDVLSQLTDVRAFDPNQTHAIDKAIQVAYKCSSVSPRFASLQKTVSIKDLEWVSIIAGKFIQLNRKR